MEIYSFLTGLVIGLLGMLVTIVSAWYYTYRYPHHITFVLENCIGLFDSIVQNMENLEVLYREKPVSKNLNLALLRGSLLNTGYRDISELKKSHHLSINLPQGFQWLEAKTVPPFSCPDVVIQHNTSELTIDWKIFQRGKYINFEALVEVPDQTDSVYTDAGRALEQVLHFEHGTADIGEVEKRELPTRLQRTRLKTLLITSAIPFALFGFIIIYAGFFAEAPAKFIYSLMKDDSKTIDVEVWPKVDGTVKLEGVSEKFTDLLPVRTFFQERKWEPKIVRRTDYEWFFWFIGIISILLLITTCPLLWEWHKMRRIIKLPNTKSKLP